MSMLIAMMTKSFESILEHTDTEWKFARSKLYLEFINQGSTLPIPLNIIPTPHLIWSIIKKIFCIIKYNNEFSSDLPSNNISEKSQKEIEEPHSKDNELTYQVNFFFFN